MKPVIYLMNVLGLSPFVLEERKRFRKFRASKYLSIYSAVMLPIFLVADISVLVELNHYKNLDNVYKFVCMLKISSYIMTHNCFLFFTLLFRDKVLDVLHVLLSFNSSTCSTFTSYDRNFNCINGQLCVLVTLHSLNSVLVILAFDVTGYVQICRYFVITASIFSIYLVTLLFTNLAVLLKRCLTRINTCLCELIQRAGEESVGASRQISIVKVSQPLIEVNYKSNKSKGKIVHIRMSCDFVCDFVDLFNSVFSFHTLGLVTYYFIIFTYDSFCAFVGIVNVNKGQFWSKMWIIMTVSETVLSALLFTVLMRSCTGTTAEVRRCINIRFLVCIFLEQCMENHKFSRVLIF
jgi:hypothetical protein